MVKNIIYILIIFLSYNVSGQETNTPPSIGVITYISNESVYVKFKDTKLLKTGDTLLVSLNDVYEKCLIVRQKSTTSCVCRNFTKNILTKGNKVKQLIISPILEVNNGLELDSTNIILESKIIKDTLNHFKKDQERIRGRISVSTYSTIPSYKDNNHRLMLRLNLNAFHIKDSKYSFNSYINYRQNFIKQVEGNPRKTKFFRIYNLALKYDYNSSTSILFGRQINNKVSSLGAIDGVQVEKIFGKNYSGIIVGFRPDIVDYSINTNLFQYGVFLGRAIQNKFLYSKTTIGAIEQKNKINIDRRYIYLQHSSTIKRKLSIFGSMELDLYNNVSDSIQKGPRLTNFFGSIRYRPKRWLSISGSYDSRKRVVYYETNKTEIEKILDDDESRQGLRFSMNIKPYKYINSGITYSKRFQQSRINLSENINIFLSYTKIPIIGGRFSVRYNINKSTYRKGNILALRYYTTIIKRLLTGNFYYRHVDNIYYRSDIPYKLSYYGINLSYRLTKTLNLSLTSEISTPKDGNNIRINTKLIKRFDTKYRKK